MTRESLHQIIAALNDAGVRYLVVGGIAVIAHGYARLTRDVDLMIQLDEANILKALRALGKLGYRSHLKSLRCQPIGRSGSSKSR